MLEMLQNLWNACKSGDVQAVLAVCFAIITATSPIWIKLINVSVKKWKYRYDATKEAAKLNFTRATEVSDKANDLMHEISNFINNSNASFNNLADLLEYIINNSTLTDPQKAYAKETYINKIKTVKPIEAKPLEVKEEPKPVEEPKPEKVEPETPLEI